MQSHLIFCNSLLLTTFFMSTAAATTAQKAESDIPHLSEIELPQTQAELLTQDTPSQTTDEDRETADIELDVITSPLVNYIEERQNSPTGVIIIDQREIKRFNYRTVGEVLRRQPGVVLGGPPGEEKDVQLLGLPKEYTQILIDGQRFPDGGENRELKVDRIPVSLVERIEIISSPNATIDSQGIAGTINIILKKAPNRRIAEMTVSGTKLDNSSPFGGVNLLYGDTQGNFSYLLSGGIQRRQVPKNKFKRSFDSANNPIDDEQENETKRLLDISLSPRLTWQVSPRDTLSFRTLFLRTEEEKDAISNSDKQKFFRSGRVQEIRQEIKEKEEDKTVTGWRIGGNWERELSSTAQMNFGLLFQRTDERKDKVETKTNNITTFRDRDVNPLDRIRENANIKREQETKFEQGLLGTFNLNFSPWENHRVRVGIEGNIRDREKEKSGTEQQILPQLSEEVKKEKTGPKDLYTIRENQLNIFVQDEISLGDKHTLTAGLRMEKVTLVT